MRATINGLSFDEWPRDFDQSFVITPGGLTGWLSGSTMRRDETERPSAHGAFDAPGYLPARTPAIEGTILASSEAVLERMILQLTGLLADGSEGRLTVQDDNGNATWADVRLASCDVERHPSGLEADYQVQFWAPDPRRRGEARSFGPAGSVDVFHRGNFPALLEFVLVNPPSSYTVGAGTKLFQVSGAPSGGTHRIDLSTGRLYRDEVLQTGFVFGDLWTLPPGEPTTHVVTGASSVTVRTVDTFV
ncbi:hypothetical protein [Microbacterium sp. KNMS]